MVTCADQEVTGQAYFQDGYHVFDQAVSFRMDSGYCWNIAWENAESAFAFSEGEEIFDDPALNYSKVLDTTEAWKEYTGFAITRVEPDYLDIDPPLLLGCHLFFGNGSKVSVLIGDSLAEEDPFSVSMERAKMDVIYIVFGPTSATAAVTEPESFTPESIKHPPVSPEVMTSLDFLNSNSAGLPFYAAPDLASEEIDLIRAIVEQLRDVIEPSAEPSSDQHEIRSVLEQSNLLGYYESIDYLASYHIIGGSSKSHFMIAALGSSEYKGKKPTRIAYQDIQPIVITNLNYSYGNILIRPESMGDKVLEIFRKVELDFPEARRFSSRYYFLADQYNLGRSFATAWRLELMNKYEQLHVEVRGAWLIAKFLRTINYEDCMSLVEIASQV
jgi:hypothetical protein